MRQSPRGLREQLPTFGPSGRQLRLNCCDTSAEFRQTVVMITHNNDIARLADRIVRIEDGKIVE